MNVSQWSKWADNTNFNKKAKDEPAIKVVNNNVSSKDSRTVRIELDEFIKPPVNNIY